MKSLQDIETNILILGLALIASYIMMVWNDFNRQGLFAIVSLTMPGLLVGLTSVLYFFGRLIFKEYAWIFSVVGSTVTVYIAAALRFNLPLPF